MASIFGFQISRKKQQQAITSVVGPSSDDGSALVSSAAGYYGLVVDLEGIVKNEYELIRRYRDCAMYSDCDNAIDEIVNESIVADPGKPPVSINLDSLGNISKAVKDKISEEFKGVLKLYRFDDRGHDLFRQWYVDGRIYFHIVLNEKNIKNGIVELRYIDPRKIKRIKNVEKKKNEQGIDVTTVLEEYYLYNDKGISSDTTQGIKLSLDSVICCTSGLVDSNTNVVLSYLHPAIKPVNQLKMMEDASVIYRITRAPERRIFYIDVGNLPKIKAEQHVTELMNRFRNKMVYNHSTGEMMDQRNHLSMQEDLFIPRRGNGTGTEITTLPGASNLDAISDLSYFQNKLYQSLRVPLGRLQPQQGFTLGRSTEVTREELKFQRFIDRLRKKFSGIFKDALRVQLITKGIINPDEWEDFISQVRFDFNRDNHFAELKESEIMMNRMGMLQQIDPYVGKYYSSEWVRRNILMQTDDEMEAMEEQMEIDREIEMQRQIQQAQAMQAMQGQEPNQGEQQK